MKVSVIGCGRWGSFLAWYLDRVGHQTALYGRKGSAHLARLRETRSNGMLSLPEKVQLTEDLEQAVSRAEILVISIACQQLRQLMQQLVLCDLRGKNLVLCMKGLEAGSGKRLTQVAEEFLPPQVHTAVWVGPGHVQDFVKGIPNCMVIDSKDEELKNKLVESFSSPLIRFYYGEDLLGNEIGAASKNVIGIAAGMLDGLGKTALKGALMSRGTREIARLIGAMGGKESSAYGLAHLGDYQATVFSQYSHNRAFGESFVTGRAYGELAEGAETVKALLKLEELYGAQLPICRAISQVLYNGRNAEDALSSLFLRSLKREMASI